MLLVREMVNFQNGIVPKYYAKAPLIIIVSKKIDFMCSRRFSSLPETKIAEFANRVDLDEVARNGPPNLCPLVFE